MNQKLSPAGIVILVAGTVMLIASFLAFWTIELGPFSADFNAWDGDALFPVSILPVLYGVEMAAHVAVVAFAKISLPDRVLGFTWNQIHLALGVQAVLMTLAFLVADKGGAEAGIGLWLMLLASVALVVGAVMREREPAATV